MPAPEHLIVTDETWRATRALFGRYAYSEVEAGLYWYGARSAEAATVSFIGVPEQVNRRTNFDVEAESLAILTRRVPEPLVVVAQLHTHPGTDTNHSPWDDERAVSRKIFSLVLPYYGNHATLEQAAVHEYVDSQWCRLNQPEAASRIIRLPTLIDTRQ